jgi:ATP synthase F1 subcomplex delta subunit
MRYAKALMEYAKSMGAEDTLYKEFCMLDRSFRKHPDLRMALENPILTIREKLTLICTAAVGDAPAGREFARFMTLVLKNRRENFLQYICLSFLDLYRKDKHIGVGKLITGRSRQPGSRGSASMTVLCSLLPPLPRSSIVTLYCPSEIFSDFTP